MPRRMLSPAVYNRASKRNFALPVMPECCCKPRKAHRALVAAMAVLALVANSAAAASPCGTLPRAQDELWLVNSRGLSSCDLELNAERM